jgi:hypothetical protein
MGPVRRNLVAPAQRSARPCGLGLACDVIEKLAHPIGFEPVASAFGALENLLFWTQADRHGHMLYQ